MKLVTTRLAAETLEKQLPAEIAEGQREEGLPHLPSAAQSFIYLGGGALHTLKNSTHFILGLLIFLVQESSKSF